MTQDILTFDHLRQVPRRSGVECKGKTAAAAPEEKTEKQANLYG